MSCLISGTCWVWLWLTESMHACSYVASNTAVRHMHELRCELCRRYSHGQVTFWVSSITAQITASRCLNALQLTKKLLWYHRCRYDVAMWRCAPEARRAPGATDRVSEQAFALYRPAIDAARWTAHGSSRCKVTAQACEGGTERSRCRHGRGCFSWWCSGSNAEGPLCSTSSDRAGKAHGRFWSSGMFVTCSCWWPVNSQLLRRSAAGGANAGLVLHPRFRDWGGATTNLASCRCSSCQSMDNCWWEANAELGWQAWWSKSPWGMLNGTQHCLINASRFINGVTVILFAVDYGEPRTQQYAADTQGWTCAKCSRLHNTMRLGKSWTMSWCLHVKDDCRSCQAFYKLWWSS